MKIKTQQSIEENQKHSYIFVTAPSHPHKILEKGYAF